MEREKEKRVNLINESTETLHFGSQVPGFFRQCLHLQELVIFTGIPPPTPPLPPPPTPNLLTAASSSWVGNSSPPTQQTSWLSTAHFPPAADLPRNFHSSFLAFKVVSGP